MGTKEIEKVLIRACETLEIVPLSHIYLPDDFPEGRIAEDCMVIHVKRPQRGDVFYTGFVEINTCVPDNGGRTNHERLEEIEPILIDAFKYDTVGEWLGETYRYGLNSYETFAEKEAGYHFINVRLLFEILNI